MKEKIFIQQGATYRILIFQFILTIGMIKTYAYLIWLYLPRLICYLLTLIKVVLTDKKAPIWNNSKSTN